MELLILLIIVAAVFYVLYVGLIHKQNAAKESFSGIDVQLKKRHDLIPNVLTIAQKFMDHEKSLLTEITALRTKAESPINPADADALKQKFAAEAQLDNKMKSLFVAVENYPTLKSDTVMVQAQQTYNEVEEHISAARRFYNSAVTELNNAVKVFPGSIVAGMLAIKEMPYFEATEADRKEVNAADILK